jgi:hypothetical protein
MPNGPTPIRHSGELAGALAGRQPAFLNVKEPMMGRRILITACAVLGLVSATPAWAKNDKIPPGDPCGIGPGVGTGNPCNGNNGNQGDQGNSGNGHGNGGGVPDFEVPPLPGHGAYITQIGDYSRADVSQTNSKSLAIVWQHGDGNEADVTQNGTARDFALVKQLGKNNDAAVLQQGGGENVLYAVQGGDGNHLASSQTSTAASNGAIMAQFGANNEMSLVQNGSDNQALLKQLGDENEMHATQNNDGNRLVWVQAGNKLPKGNQPTQITQNGGGNLIITQTGGW